MSKKSKKTELVLALSADLEPFEVGDWALHVNNQLDSREVVGIGDDFIDLQIGTARTGPVPSDNYHRIPKDSR